eukprot:scpid3934/ scgid10255/ 
MGQTGIPAVFDMTAHLSTVTSPHLLPLLFPVAHSDHREFNLGRISLCLSALALFSICDPLEFRYYFYTVLFRRYCVAFLCMRAVCRLRQWSWKSCSTPAST